MVKSLYGKGDQLKLQKHVSESKYYSKSGLKHRGWTDKGIELFLKTHDDEAENPYYKSAAPMKLYLISRVEEIENSAQFMQFQNKNKKRVDSSRKAVETKKDRLLEQVKGWNISLKNEDYQKVIKNAIRSYNNFKGSIALERDNFDFEPATLDSDELFLERITVNYLRHNLSDYDNKLERLFGKVGKSEAYDILNEKIYSTIAEVYHELKEECERQLSRKKSELVIGLYR